MVKARRDIVNSLVLIAFAVGYLWLSQDIPSFSDRAYGPAFMPVVVGTAILVLAVLLLVASIVRARREGEQKLVLNAGQLFRENEKVLYIFIATGLYVLAVTFLGYLIATPLFMLLVYYVVVRSWGRRPWLIVLGYLAFSVLIYVVFEQALQIPLPEGVLL